MGTSLPFETILFKDTVNAISTMFREVGNIFEIAPPASVDTNAPEIPRFVKTEDYSDTDTVRAPGALPKEIKSSYEFYSVNLLNNAISESIDYTDLIKIEALNKTLTFDNVVYNLVDSLSNNMHKKVKAELENATNYDAGAGEQAPGSGLWTVAGATPRTDMRNLKIKFRTRQGAEPSALILSRDVVDAIQNGPTDWVSFWQNKAIPESEIEQLQKYFSVDKVIIPGKYSGINGNFSNYYTKLAVLATIDPVGQGELIGNIMANRSALRFYFLDQNSSLIQRDPAIREQWYESARLGYYDKQIIKVFQRWEKEGFALKTYGVCDWVLDVPNKYGLARMITFMP